MQNMKSQLMIDPRTNSVIYVAIYIGKTINHVSPKAGSKFEYFSIYRIYRDCMSCINCIELPHMHEAITDTIAALHAYDSKKSEWNRL